MFKALSDALILPWPSMADSAQVRSYLYILIPSRPMSFSSSFYDSLRSFQFKSHNARTLVYEQWTMHGNIISLYHKREIILHNLVFSIQKKIYMIYNKLNLSFFLYSSHQVLFSLPPSPCLLQLCWN